MQSSRSPINLRPRKINSKELDTTNISKQEVKKMNMRVTETSLKLSKITKPNQNNTAQTSDKMKLSDIIKEIASIKQSMNEQRSFFSKAIDQLHHVIADKNDEFQSVVSSLKLDVDDIKSILNKRNNQMLESNWKHTNINETIDYLIRGNCIEQLEQQYEIQIDEMRRKISAIETRNKQTEEVMYNIAVFAADQKESTDILSTELENKQDNLINAITCIQGDVNRFNLSMHSNEEKISKLNHQMHVLSAMFVDFNKRVTEHVYELNRQNITKIETDQIIDPSTTPFIERKRNLNNKQIKVANHFLHNKLSVNRFEGKFNRVSHSKFVVVRMNETNIHSLNDIPAEFKRKFEMHTNKNIVQNIAVLKYKIRDGIIFQIDVMVSFNVPVSSNYLNDMMFPCNWTFFEIKNQLNQQSKNPTNHQRMNAVKLKSKPKSMKPRKKPIETKY